MVATVSKVPTIQLMCLLVISKIKSIKPADRFEETPTMLTLLDQFPRDEIALKKSG